MNDCKIQFVFPLHHIPNNTSIHSTLSTHSLTHPLTHRRGSRVGVSSGSDSRGRRGKDRCSNRALGARSDRLGGQERGGRSDDLDGRLAVLGVSLCADGAAGHGRVDDLGRDDLRRGGDDDGGLVVLALFGLFGLGGQGGRRECDCGARGLGRRC